MDEWVEGWKDGWMDGEAGLRIAYSNQKLKIENEECKMSNEKRL